MNDHRLALSLLAGLLVVVAGCTGTPGTTPGADTPTSPTPTPVVDGTPTTSPGTGRTPTDRQTGTPSAFETYVFDHAGVETPAIEGGIAYAVDDSYTTRYYVTTVATREAVGRFDERVLDGGARAFVGNTSFADASLVVIQAFPASSVPDYRVESVRRADGTLHVAINDSSTFGTNDVTVETVLLRVPGSVPERVVVTTEEGHTFDTSTGVVTVTPRRTPTPEPEIELPYASENESENVADPRGIRLANSGNHTNGYRLSVVYHDRPDCMDATPPCGMPIREVTVLERTGKLRAGGTVSIPDLVARRGNYTVTIRAFLPVPNGSRRTVERELRWTIDDDARNLRVRLTDESITVRRVSSE